MSKEIKVVVAPKQKVVKIMVGKKVVKTYNFKMDIPKKVVEKEVTGYDWGTWSVADRDYTYTQKVTEYDKDVIEQIKQKALEFYNQQNT